MACSGTAWDPDGSEWVCLFGQDQSGVGAALCRAHSKTPSFFRRHAVECIPMAEMNPPAQNLHPVEGGVGRAATDSASQREVHHLMRYTTPRGCSGLCLVRDSVVDCGSPLPLLDLPTRWTAALDCADAALPIPKQPGPSHTFR
jgi:hypothetical protein